MRVGEADQIEVIAQACIKANDLIQESGTDMMKTIMRVLLFEIGQEIARRECELELRKRSTTPDAKFL